MLQLSLPRSPRLGLVLSLLWLLTGLLAAACGDTSPTARPPAQPTATPAPPPPLAYLAEVEFKFADQAERAQRTLTGTRPDFPAYATWTQNNHWFVLARDSSDQKLKEKVGREARIFPVTSISEALAPAQGQPASFQAYMLSLNRATIDIKAGGAKEAAQLLFSRATGPLGIRGGLLVFTVGNDQVYALVPAVLTSDKILALASVGKVELVSAGAKDLTDGAVVATSASPLLGDLKLTDSTIYPTLAENRDFGTFRARSNTAVLNFELRQGNKVFEYSRANIGKYAALVYDRQVVSSAQIGAAIKDKGEILVPRWSGPAGQADMRRFIELLNAQPPQLFEAKELSGRTGLVYSGSFVK